MIAAALALALASPEPPRPLLVVLHGAGDDGRGMLEAMRPLADTRGVDLLLAPSGGSTWDIIGTDRPTGFGFAGAPRLPSGDRKRIERAIAAYSATHSIDSERIGLLGFSDGATYALSLGTADPSHYNFVAAIAPGGMLLGDTRGAVARRQRIWIAHGRADRLFPPAGSMALCRQLQSTGRSVAFAAFDGGHGVSLKILGEALDRFVGVRPLGEGCGPNG